MEKVEKTGFRYSDKNESSFTTLSSPRGNRGEGFTAWEKVEIDETDILRR